MWPGRMVVILRESGPPDRFLRNLLCSWETETEEWDFHNCVNSLLVETVCKLTAMMFWLLFALATLECEKSPLHLLHWIVVGIKCSSWVPQKNYRIYIWGKGFFKKGYEEWVINIKYSWYWVHFLLKYQDMYSQILPT